MNCPLSANSDQIAYPTDGSSAAVMWTRSGSPSPGDRCWPVRVSKQQLLQHDADHELLAARKIDVYATNKDNLLEKLTYCRARA